MHNPFRIFIANIPYSVDEAELFEFLGRWANVTAAKVTRAENGHSRGYAFADAASEEDVQTLLELNNYQYKGRTLHVERAKSSSQRHD